MSTARLAALDLMVSESGNKASGGPAPDAWLEAGLLDRRLVENVRSYLTASARVFVDARSVVPSIDFSGTDRVVEVDFEPVDFDNALDW